MYYLTKIVSEVASRLTANDQAKLWLVSVLFRKVVRDALCGAILGGCMPQVFSTVPVLVMQVCCDTHLEDK